MIRKERNTIEGELYAPLQSFNYPFIYYKDLNLQEYLLAVHNIQDDEQNGDVTDLDYHLVVIAHVLLQSEEEGFADTLETDDMADDIGSDAVHTVNLQHG